MKNEEMEKLINSVNEKLGQEASGLIADDLCLLITDNKNTNSIIDKKDNDIRTLCKAVKLHHSVYYYHKTNKENLINVNGNLLQQIAFEDNETTELKEKEKEEIIKDFDFKNAFNDKGEFI